MSKLHARSFSFDRESFGIDDTTVSDFCACAGADFFASTSFFHRNRRGRTAYMNACLSIAGNGCSLILRNARDPARDPTMIATGITMMSRKKWYVRPMTAAPPAKYKNCLTVNGPITLSSMVMNCGT